MSSAARLAVLTGAGSGIGRATLKRLVNDGLRVAAVDLNVEPITSLGLTDAECRAFPCDVSRSADIKQLLRGVAEWQKDLHPTAVVNAAGIVRKNSLLGMSEAEFDEVIAVNLKGTFLICQAFAILMKQAGQGGSIVNLSSIVGKVGHVGQTNYSASKAGVIGLTKTAARELAPFGIRCNALLPGFIETPMTADVPDEVMQMVLPQIPMGRVGTADEIADSISFLVSERSSYITGACLEVTGGLSM